MVTDLFTQIKKLNFRLKIRLVMTAVMLCISLFITCQVPAAEYTIGVIMTGDIQYYRDIHDTLMSKLRKDGYADKIVTLIQKPYPDSISLSNAARKLIANDVDVIIAYGTPAAIAVHREKTKIPVIYAGVYEPLVSRISARNITGINSKISVSSLIRYLKGMTSLSTLGVVYSSYEEDSVYQMKELSNYAEQYGIKIEAVNLKKHQDATSLLAGKKFDALFLTGSSIANIALASIMDFSRERRIPTVSLLPDRNAHIIITLCPNPKEQGEKVAEKTIKILQNVPPDKIRASTAHDIELIFDLKELINMGFKIPMDLVTEATKIIQ